MLLFETSALVALLASRIIVADAQACPEEQRVPCGGGNGGNNQKFLVCHYNGGEKEFNELCLPENGAAGHLMNHPDDTCGPCDAPPISTEDEVPQDLGPPTYPYVRLEDPLSTTSFNSIDTPLCIVLENGNFDLSIIQLEVNSITLAPALVEDTKICADPSFTFLNGENSVVFSAMTTPDVVLGEGVTGSLLLELDTIVRAGSYSVDVFLEDDLGNAFLDPVTVTATLSDDSTVTATVLSGKSLVLFSGAS